MKIKYEDYEVEYADNEEIKQQVFDRLIKYFNDCQSFSGESIMQCDNAIIEAPNAMADIADEILKFNVTWKE